MKKIAVLAGDGIGPEIMEQALNVLYSIESKYSLNFKIDHALVGGAAIDASGEALPEETLKICQESDAILFGAVGGPKWENLPPEQQPERGALLPLRKIFNLFANLRPSIIYPALVSSSPLRSDIIKDGMDILILRELTGGIYFGQPKGREGQGKDEKAYDTLVYTRKEIERIAHLAFKAAQIRNKKVTSIDKANVLTSMVFWREVVNGVAKDYPDCTLNHLYVDAATMKLISSPSSFDVMLCPNMFGDIISDEAAMITGSLGNLPSASLNEHNFGLYEPAGGSAPDIAGQNIANPIAQIMCVSMMLRYTFNELKAADDIENAVQLTLADGFRTKDLFTEGMKEVTTSQMGEEVIKRL